MSKLSNTLLLLSYLQNGRKYSISELSEKIEVSKRMIRTYKEDLEKAGFIIETIYGPYGGYILKRNNIQITPNFNSYDLEVLNNLLSSDNITSNKEDIKNLYDKIKNKISSSKEQIMTKDIQKIYNSLARAIKEKKKVKITYNSLGKGLNSRIIHPLELFYFKDNFGVAAFCEIKKDLRHFELKRIEKLSILNINY